MIEKAIKIEDIGVRVAALEARGEEIVDAEQRATYSRTPNLRKRIEALEKALLSPSTPGALSGDHSRAIDDEIMRQADAMVSRQICEHWIGENYVGRDPTSREWKAIKTYLAAIAVECKRAGYRSSDEFLFSYCRSR